MRRPPKIAPPSSRAPSRPRRPLLLAAGLLALTVCVIGALASLEIGGGAAADTDGRIDRLAYSLVRPGQTQAQVLDLLGSPPRAVESVPLGEGRPRCYVYERRSGRPGHYRFCFDGGLMVSKSRIGWPVPA